MVRDPSSPSGPAARTDTPGRAPGGFGQPTPHDRCTLDADRARRVFNGETVEPMPSEDPIHLEEVTDIDEDLAGYGHHGPRESGPAHRESGDHAATSRRPAYSETV